MVDDNVLCFIMVNKTAK